MTNETKIQWHPAFCSAIELTLFDNADSLYYDDEFTLSRKPLQLDLLVINKNNDIPLKDEVGRIFKRHNLLEYKSPEDDLNIDTYYKTIAYGCLYKSLAGSHVDEIKADEITLTLVRREKPQKLLKSLTESGIEISNDYPGIYHLKGNVLFDTQIISTMELPEGSHIWLKALTRNIDDKEARQVIKDMSKFPPDSKERQLADSVLQVAMSANFETFEKLKKEEPVMCNALKELMKPEMDEEIIKTVDKTKRAIAEKLIRDGEYGDKKIAEICELTVAQVKAIRNEMLVKA